MSQIVELTRRTKWVFVSALVLCILWFLTRLSQSGFAAMFGMKQRKSVAPSLTGSVGLVILAHNREEYYKECLKSVLRASNWNSIDIIVSMDYAPSFAPLRRIGSGLNEKIQFWENAEAPAGLESASKIGFHYKTVFERAFVESAYDYIIVLESDLIVSRDFIEYFISLREVLDPSNPSVLWCASAWNDNGMEYLTLDPSRLMRTDFFPGLAWMIHRSTWTDVLAPIWPERTGNYDWWIRDRPELKGQDCVFPEVPRVHHIAKYGLHVNGKGFKWYDQMALSKGGESSKLSDNAIKVVGSFDLYEAWLKLEKIIPAKVIPFDPGMKIPLSSLIVILVSLDGSKSNNYRIVAKFFSLYSEFRSSHKGLLTFTMGKKTGYSSITLISEEFREYWGLSATGTVAGYIKTDQKMTENDFTAREAPISLKIV